MNTTLDEQATRKRRNNLTNGEKAAIIAACAAGARKSTVAKEFNLHPSQVSRILTDVKTVNSPSNPLSHDYKATLKSKAIESITRGLEASRDPYAAANIGVKVMQGIGEFVNSSNVQVAGTVAMTVSWSMPSQAEVIDAEPLDVVVEGDNQSLITGDRTQLIDT